MAVKLGQGPAEQRLEAFRHALEVARSPGIDELRMQATFLVDPPPGLADQLKGLIREARARFGWTRVANPSSALLDVALAASPYLKSVLFCHGEVMLAGVSDAAEDLSIVVTEDAWNKLRLDLETILGMPLRFDTAELNDPFAVVS